MAVGGLPSQWAAEDARMIATVQDVLTQQAQAAKAAATT